MMGSATFSVQTPSPMDVSRIHRTHLVNSSIAAHIDASDVRLEISAWSSSISGLGPVSFRSAFYGVLFGNALMLFTFCLMLFAWVPFPWALVVSGMFGLCLSPGMYWTNSYWGGSVAASGGALVLLGVGIYRARQTPLAGAIFAVGALLLFWTRPFEGGVFTLIVLMVFAKELWRNRRASVFVAAVSVLAVGGAWTCYYNQAVTGNPFSLPYLVHDRQYNVTPVFWFLPLRPEPTYSHPRLASQYRSKWVGSIGV